MTIPESIMTPEEGIHELPGEDPRWLWAFTCPTPGCDCRTAIVLSTTGDREALIARGAPVRSAWLRREGHAKAASKAPDVTAFALDIDSGEVLPAYSEDVRAVFDVDAHPTARAVIDRIDGEVLDAIARLWYRGKNWPDPEEERRVAAQIKIEDWRPGEFIPWGEALVGVRQDIYRLGDRVFDAIDLYCVAEGCACGVVVLSFAPVAPRGSPDPGAVRVGRSGKVIFEPAHERHRVRLEELWAAFRKRYPRFVERFARRSAVMQEISGRVVGVPSGTIARRTAKVGRNDPCPCGTGKKYKKCCGAT